MPDAELQRTRAVLVVEDIADTRRWLIRLAGEAFGPVEVASAPDLRSARHWLAGRDTQGLGLTALIDLGLPDGSGVTLIRELRDRHPAVRIVVTTIFDDDNHLLHAMAAGAQGYLLKDRDAGELVEQLRGLERGDMALSPTVARRMLEHFRAHAHFVTADAAIGASAGADLTARESEVLGLIGRGLTLNEAAGVLGISSQTVASHVKAVYRKLGIATRAEAALEAARRSLI